MPKRLREENESASESSKRRKFQCPRCPSVLYSKGHLKIHMRYHTGERPYKCDFCDKCFAERSTLRKHEATHRDPDFWCPFCRKGFCREDSLRVHVRYHNDINPYICTTCNETFRTSSHLREHFL